MNMAKLNLYFVIFTLFLISSNSGGFLKFTHGQVGDQPTWCIAKPSTPAEILQSTIVYACGELPDCKIIQYGGTCFEPDELGNHASVVMNLYYQKNGRHPWNCDFKNTGVVAITDPSYGSCKYEFKTEEEN